MSSSDKFKGQVHCILRRCARARHGALASDIYHAIKFNMHDGGGGGQSSREEPHVAQEAGKTDHKAPPTSQTSSNLNRETDWWLPWLLPTWSLTQRRLTAKDCRWLLVEAAGGNEGVALLYSRDKRKCTMQSNSIVDAREQGMALISLGDQRRF